MQTYNTAFGAMWSWLSLGCQDASSTATPSKSSCSLRSSSTPRRRRQLWSSRSSIIISSLALTRYASAQDRDPVQSFCRRFGHQTALIDDRLFIDGGLVNWNPISQYPSNYTNRGLLYQDLSYNGPTSMPQLQSNLTKNSSVPVVSGGILWADDVNKWFYLFGGENFYQDPPPPTFSLYGYDALNDVWENFGIPTQATINGLSYGAGVAVSETGLAYYYGGWMSNNSILDWTGPPVATSTMIRFDMDSNSWLNTTGPDSTRRAEGVMVHIPAGDGGMLIYFGGVTDEFGNGTVSGQPLDEIFVYDTLSSKWYKQTATGDVPGNRRRFCAGATWAQDQSSYNIYLYGGASMPPDTAGYDDVYVLSIPSFTWIKLYPTDTNGTGQFPHNSLTCNVVNKAQMLIIGGTFPLSDECDDPSRWGTHNLDMGQQNSDKAFWQSYRPDLTEYVVPEPILNVVGGTGTGGATKTIPDGGWEDPDLAILMTRQAIVASRTPTRNVDPGDYEDDTFQLSGGKIVGIAVGSAAAAVILLVIGFLIWRRRKASKMAVEEGKVKQQQAASADPGEPRFRDNDDSSNPFGSASNGHTPTSPFSTSPFLRHPGTMANAPAAPPAELAASGAPVWRAPDGVTYELLQTPNPADSTVPLAGGYHAGHPNAKVDEHGRVWIPQVSVMHVAARSPVGSTFDSSTASGAPYYSSPTSPLPGGGDPWAVVEKPPVRSPENMSELPAEDVPIKSIPHIKIPTPPSTQQSQPFYHP